MNEDNNTCSEQMIRDVAKARKVANYLTSRHRKHPEYCNGSLWVPVVYWWFDTVSVVMRNFKGIIAES